MLISNGPISPKSNALISNHTAVRAIVASAQEMKLDKKISSLFVGFIETSSNTYFFAVYLNADSGADGALAYETALTILKSMNIIE